MVIWVGHAPYWSLSSRFTVTLVIANKPSIGYTDLMF